MTSSSTPGTPAAIDPGTAMGAVHLTVPDLNRSRTFYEQVLGLQAIELEGGDLAFGARDGRILVQLHGDSSASPLDRRATGLFHLAILLPSRLDLAFALARLSAARWPLDGASDHLVSEALYLSDPDGNGIEIYRDRPREQWRHIGGQLEMATLPLDLRDVAAELRNATESQPHVPVGTKMGHVHLQVAELKQVEEFYAGVLGFEVTVRGYPGALFVSAGGYHHHLGLNTWNSAGAGPPAPDAVGLRHYEVLVPGRAELDSVLARVEDHHLPVRAADELAPDSHLLRDPSGNTLLLRAA